jgi:hypothetical protein
MVSSLRYFWTPLVCSHLGHQIFWFYDWLYCHYNQEHWKTTVACLLWALRNYRFYLFLETTFFKALLFNFGLHINEMCLIYYCCQFNHRFFHYCLKVDYFYCASFIKSSKECDYWTMGEFLNSISSFSHIYISESKIIFHIHLFYFTSINFRFSWH